MINAPRLAGLYRGNKCTTTQQPIGSLHSIPHKGGVRQAELPIYSDSNGKKLLFHAFHQLNDRIESSIQREARLLQYQRLHRTDIDHGLHTLFTGLCNIAVMCGRTSDNLFVLDCETKESFAHCIHMLQTRHIPLWAVVTARGGHIYLRSKDGEVANIHSDQIPHVEVRGHNRYILAPPSVHPSGDVYRWFKKEGTAPPLVNVKQIDWLTDQNGDTVELKLRKSKKVKADFKKGFRTYPTQYCQHNLSHQHLSQQTKDYIANGAGIPEGNRNNRLFSAACDMCGNNFDQRDTFAVLSQPAKPVTQFDGGGSILIFAPPTKLERL